MKRQIYGAAALLTIFQSVNIAHADWQYTRWGMSVEQVSKASRGKAMPWSSKYNNKEYQVELAAVFQSGPFLFNVNFEFQEERGLTIVSLHPANKSDCPSIETTMAAKYGASDPEPRQYGAYKWNDRKGNNVVRYVPLNDGCVITYKALATPGGAKGL